ncbi:MAG: hypothetical protein PF588_10860 [Candidatus Kapabacteria bacterium]|nr:hypothetical protein [Candidatus Kapabacteria bacterium]
MKKMNKTRGLRVFLLIAGLFFALQTYSAEACEIDFKVLKGKKTSYEVDDVIIVKVEVFLTHRNCPEPMSATKYNQVGLKIEKNTKWKNPSANTYTQKLKIKITEAGSKKISLGGVRTCDKTGGVGSITIQAEK